MAMDRETLLQRLQTQYLTRQEVLFRLPLNFSINSFWPELVERRKINSVILPLHRCDGKPYWYVLTDKIADASYYVSITIFGFVFDLTGRYENVLFICIAFVITEIILACGLFLPKRRNTAR